MICDLKSVRANRKHYDNMSAVILLFNRKSKIANNSEVKL